MTSGSWRWRWACLRRSSAFSSICRDGSRPRRRSRSRWRLAASSTFWRWCVSASPQRCSRMRGELASREELFWGGGHVLQFVYAALMVTNWSILARMSLGERGGRQPHLPRVARPHHIDRNRGASVLRDFRSLLRPSARGVPLLAVRDRRADADLRRFACRPRPSLTRPMAVARSGFLRARGVAGALRAGRRDGVPDRRLGYPHARALSRGHHRGQRLERRHAAHLRSQGTGQAACAAARDARSSSVSTAAVSLSPRSPCSSPAATAPYAKPRPAPDRSTPSPRPAWRCTGSLRSSPFWAARLLSSSPYERSGGRVRLARRRDPGS